jgi:hypothetical protein
MIGVREPRGSIARANPAPAPRPTESIPDLVAKIRSVPDEARHFSVTAAGARSAHRIDADLLDALLAEGLPSVGPPGGRLFDDYDLGNAALHLGLMSVRRMAIRSWAHALRRNSERDFSRARVGFVPRCPAPGHRHPCQFGLLQPGGRRRIVPGPGSGTAAISHLDVELRGGWPTIEPAARDLIAELADVQFFILPEVVRWDPAFLMRTRIADCGGAADWLVKEGRRRGLTTRFSFGLLVTSPYATPHCWAEFRTDGIWVPVDPMLIGVMPSLDREQWPPYRSAGAIMSRLSGRFTKVASHGGIWTALSMPTEYLP